MCRKYGILTVVKRIYYSMKHRDGQVELREFDNQEIRFIDGKPVANDVATVLGYKNPADAVFRLVKEKNKGKVKMRTLGGVQSVMVLEEAGVLELIATSRLPNAIDIAERIGLVVLKCKHEQESIRIIKAAFEDLQPIEQFRIHGYRIDLYLAAVNITIECDENNHPDYKYPLDPERQKTIKSALGCSFIRYNPNEPGFNVGSVIYKIRELL